MFWLYVFAGIGVFCAALWLVDRRRTSRRVDGGTFDRNINRAIGDAQGRDTSGPH